MEKPHAQRQTAAYWHNVTSNYRAAAPSAFVSAMNLVPLTMNDDCFTSFLCDHCHTEIEATFDLIGQRAECPACGVKLTVPDNRD